ncbi:cob(I)yrinic acid a,c-diamide adenosyltransferase [Candidatus Gottesmanbacteria bacterium]|nr:cob(I)yrinic acid a,c-diamide adenosyltransferase [Candidatus Gottesmanbacteria bacterium]
MPIYTRTGDAGQTSLFGGKRVPKSEPLVDVYGSIDELNSWVGFVSASFPSEEVQTFLSNIQSDLFTIGSVFAGWSGDLSILSKRVKEMEDRIDLMEKDLTPLTNFILPGGSAHGAHVHITRSVCRRVERQVVALFSSKMLDVRLQQGDKETILMYINRLSDLFFVLARFINKKEHVEETVWTGIAKTKKQ